MFKLFKKFVYACVIFLMVMPLVSCGGSGSDTGGGTTGGGTTGTLVLGLTDDPGDYLHVYVTIKEVQVHQAVEGEDDDSGWLTVLTPGETFDLLVLQNGVIASLGLAELEAGKYNQMRLILDEEKPVAHPYANYLVIEGEEGEDPVEVELKVPSGFKTGIKIVHGFTIVASGATELILDFDANKSIVQAGKSGKWLLKPTIKVLETVTNSVSGKVDTIEEDISVAVVGASVSAQVYDSVTGDLTGAGGAESDTVGDYFMYLPITNNIYNIVATMDGYASQCKVLDLSQPTEPVDFTLIAEATGTLIGSVTGLAAPEDSAFFSIRQAHTSCGMIEVASASVLNTMPTDLEPIYFEPITLPVLPVGTYQVVVSAEGEGTQVFDVVVEADPPEPALPTPTVLDVVFPTL
jgi:hypothetical protein